jgi:hypothetical protein
MIVITSFLVSAGFGSTYIPEINGKDILQVPIGTSSNYYIYPQNFEDKILLVKVKILNGSEIITNILQETYEIPINTTSDDFPIKLIFKLENKSELIGKEYFISYEILTTYKGNDTEGIVSFSPIGYKKSFYVKGIEPIYVPEQPVNNTQDTTQSTQQSSSSNKNNKVTNVKKANEIIKTPTPQPETNKLEIETEKPAVTEISVVPTDRFLDFLKNINWEYIIFTFIGICILGFIIFIIKAYKNRNNMDYYGSSYIEKEIRRK